MMRDLHELLRDMQNRLPAPVAALPTGTEVHPASNVEKSQDAVVVSDIRPRQTKKKSGKSKTRAKRQPSKSKKGSTTFLHRDVREFFPFLRR